MNRTPLRILYVHHNSDTYGASRSLIRLLSKLHRDRFAPLVVLADDGPLRPLLEALNVEVIIHKGLSVITRSAFKSWRIIPFILNFPLSVIFLWKLIRQRKIDIVHTNTGVIVSSGLAAKCAGVPHFWHIRDWFQEFKGLWTFHSKYILWSSEKIISVSKAMADQFPPSPKIVVIHNGFSLEEFAAPKEKLAQEFRARFQLGSELVVGCVGRIKLVRKGQEVFVKAAALLKQKGWRAKYVIVGAPFAGNENHLADLKKMVRDFGLGDDVVFTGELKDPRPAYAAMDVFILPSAQPEPFGGVVMEAMAMGVPVIATNIGGSIDQVAEGETGFLVPPSDPQALADRIERLMNDLNLRKKMAEAGPRRIAEKFSLDEMVGRFENLYEGCAKSRPIPL